jgi:phosphoglycolate phosphatase
MVQITGPKTEIQRRLQAKSHIIWDWNGTLLDDVQLCFETMRYLLRERGLPELTPERYRAAFRMPIIEFYRDLGFDFERVPFEQLARDFMQRYETGVLHCSLFAGTRDLLEALSQEGKRLAILSAAKEDYLRRLASHFEIAAFFDAIFGLDDHYAVSKIDRGRELMSHWNVDPASIILVGDMDHDAEVGQALGIEVLLLADGHQALDRLRNFPHVLEYRHQ